MGWDKGKTSFYDQPDFVEWCFKTAEKYFPANQLVVNERTHPSWEDKCRPTDNYYAYIEANLLKGARIDAIGMQFHMFFKKDREYEATRSFYNPKNLYAHMDLYSNFGKPLQVTEVTIPAYSNSAEDEALQAEILKTLYSIWFSHKNIEQIVYWNLVDGYAHLWDPSLEKIKASQGNMTLGENVYYGGLFRFDMTPKPAYFAIKAINHQKGSIDMDMMLGKNYEVFTIPHHATGIHLTQKGMDYLEDYVKQVRNVIGYEVPLAIDHFGHICIEDCIMFAKRLEKYNIAWIEDIAPWHYTEHYVKIANNCNVPICTGEDIYLAENFEPLMKNGGVSVVHPDMLTVGGAMEMKKLGNMCDKYGVAMAIHMAESPIACMAAIHAAAAVQNVLAVEFHSVDIPWWNDLAIGIDNPLFKDGFVDVPNKPGLGIDELNEELIAEHMHEKYPGIWEPTTSWDNEWANDREWS